MLCTIDLQYMKTERGTNLLTSGWWGVSRHPNYVRTFNFGHREAQRLKRSSAAR